MTTSPPPARPLYLAAVPDVVFGMFHPPANQTSMKTAVLICPPWGWDEIASYRSRRTWAEHLAAHGHPAVRIDFPASGDSAGSPGDPDRVAAWTAAVVAAARWLADTTPSGRVAIVGLGLGGLIAGEAVAAGAPIDELVLWATPAQGRGFLREQRAFGKLQSDRYGETDADDGTLPDGWLEIGGFVQSAGTIAAIERLDLRAMDSGSLQRVLLLGRDGLPVDAAVQRRLEQAGVNVTVAAGDGWGSMCFHPERYEPPLDVFERVTDWLGNGGLERTATSTVPRRSRSDSVAAAQGIAAAQATIEVDGVRIRETPLTGDDLPANSFGILAEPLEPTGTDLCAVFLNAGAVRRIGPNRMWVEAARRWAASGIPTVRVDAEGIGDADGDGAMYVDLARFYTPDREARVTAIMDTLEARGVGKRFVLIGLCAGAYSAFNAAASDSRVVTAVAVNPKIMVWDPAILARRNAFVVTEVFGIGSWQRILNGETSPARVLEIGRAAVAEAPRLARRYAGRLRGGKQRDPWTVQTEDQLDALLKTRTRMVLAFSGDEQMHDELQAEGVLDERERWPNLVLTDLPGDDHTLRPIAAQRAFHRLLDRELELLLAEPASRVAEPSAI